MGISYNYSYPQDWQGCFHTRESQTTFSHQMHLQADGENNKLQVDMAAGKVEDTAKQ